VQQVKETDNTQKKTEEAKRLQTQSPQQANKLEGEMVSFTCDQMLKSDDNEMYFSKSTSNVHEKVII